MTKGDHQNDRQSSPRANPAPRREMKRLDPAEIRERSRAANSRRTDDLKASLSERALKAVLNTPGLYLSRRLKALTGDASPLVAIRAKCEACVGWEEVTARVGDCRSRDCELWHHRPYQEEKGKHPVKDWESYHD